MRILAQLINGYNALKAAVETLTDRVDEIAEGELDSILPDIPDYNNSTHTVILSINEDGPSWRVVPLVALLDQSATSEINALTERVDQIEESIGGGSLVPNLPSDYDPQTQQALLTQTVTTSGSINTYENSWKILSKINALICSDTTIGSVTLLHDNNAIFVESEWIEAPTDGSSAPITRGSLISGSWTPTANGTHWISMAYDLFGEEAGLMPVHASQTNKEFPLTSTLYNMSLTVYDGTLYYKIIS